MNWDQWQPLHKEISQDFGFSLERDRKTAILLNTFLDAPDLKRLKKTFRNKDVNIFGAGPSLTEIKRIPSGTIVAADGVTNYLLELDTTPDIIVTDLDGKIDDILLANRVGSVVFLHAHGDNKELVSRYAKKFRDLYGTTQVKPFGKLLNFGGFTDGDRAVYIAEHFKPKKISLHGMDFDKNPGKYSFTQPEMFEVKMRKLKWAKRLIAFLQENTAVKIEYCQASGL